MPRQRARITWRNCGRRRCGRADRQSAIPKPVKLRSRLTRATVLCGKRNSKTERKANDGASPQDDQSSCKVESQAQALWRQAPGTDEGRTRPAVCGAEE